METRFYTPTSFDPYYGYQLIAVVSSTFIAHNFGAQSLPDGVPRLDHFVANILRRTKIHQTVAYAALYLLGFLKQRFYHQLQGESWASNHRLFLTAFIIAGKVLVDQCYSTKTCAELAGNTITFKELARAEREILALLDWKLNIDPEDLHNFMRKVERDFIGHGPYPTYSFNIRGGNEPVRIPEQMLAESTVPGYRAVNHTDPEDFIRPQLRVPDSISHPDSRESHPTRLATRSASATTAMRQVSASPVMMDGSRPAAHRATTMPVTYQHQQQHWQHTYPPTSTTQMREVAATPVTMGGSRPMAHRATTMPVTYQHQQQHRQHTYPPTSATQMRHAQRNVPISLGTYVAAVPQVSHYATGMSHASVAAAARKA